MTNKEAIEILSCYYERGNDRQNTAMDMAIEALNHSEIPNSSDCISRQAAIEVADAIWTVTGDKNVAKVWQQLKDLSSAQLVRKRGTYTESGENDEWYCWYATCNECGKEWMGSRNFCPHCGCQMER